ncbi:MAG: UDP-N-acetyl-D-glucosamine dehydrogenase, partial [Bacillus sp. (in: Bacteria)]|nr:UDP-N-acetyl-D-glucosamine dehydrogenase [Bacillus sp. (in: firmicutes)]
MLENTRHAPFKTIGVIGLGFVGLPLALLFNKKGFKVIGIDVDQTKINDLKQNASYIPDISDEEIRRAKASGRFIISTNYQCASIV